MQDHHERIPGGVLVGHRKRTVLGVALAAVLLGGLFAGCTSTPRAVVDVPFNYVADLWQPTLDDPSGAGSATVLMCLDEPSSVFLETGEGGEGAVGHISVEWAGSRYTAPSTGDPITYTTPVLSAGCGLLSFGPDCCHVDHYLAIRATKV